MHRALWLTIFFTLVMVSTARADLPSGVTCEHVRVAYASTGAPDRRSVRVVAEYYGVRLSEQQWREVDRCLAQSGGQR